MLAGPDRPHSALVGHFAKLDEIGVKRGEFVDRSEFDRIRRLQHMHVVCAAQGLRQSLQAQQVSVARSGDVDRCADGIAAQVDHDTRVVLSAGQGGGETFPV